MATLADRVQALPPELFNKIYDLTFTTSPTIPSPDSYNRQYLIFCRGYGSLQDRLIETPYQPPSNLQVNRATRANLAPAYYCGSLFYITKDDLWDWLASLPTSHVHMIRKIRVLNFYVRTDYDEDWNRTLRRKWDKRVYELERSNWTGIQLREGVVEFEIVQDREGTPGEWLEVPAERRYSESDCESDRDGDFEEWLGQFG